MPDRKIAIAGIVISFVGLAYAIASFYRETDPIRLTLTPPKPVIVEVPGPTRDEFKPRVSTLSRIPSLEAPNLALIPRIQVGCSGLVSSLNRDRMDVHIFCS